MTLEQLYRNYCQKDREARNLLTQTHWYSAVVGMDPRTYDALPKSQPLSKFLQTIYYTDMQLKRGAPLVWKDRLWRIIEHAKQSLTTLFRNLNESPFRDHVVLPLHSVRELDAPSLQTLARRPGRSIKEKLAGNPYLLAVRRYPSVDLPENRLLKAFAVRLSERLKLRKECLHDNINDELIFKIRSWLATDEAKSIGRWENLPPNNTLLSHRDYRRIWDSWRWLQSLDDDISNDMKRLKERQNTMEEWQGFAQMYINKKHIFAEIPIIFNNNSYDEFEIRTWDTILKKPNKEKLIHPTAIPSIDAPVCIDLTELRPRYAVLKDQKASLTKTYREPFLWQRWENKELSASSFDMGLFTADAPFLHKDTITISSSELLFSNKYTQECLGCAAREFAKKLRETFENDTLIWLQPDYLNDFELQITRSNINALFPNAEPLPRSIAAVIEKIGYSYPKLENGFIAAVYDCIDGNEIVTKLEAKFDEELLKCAPQTRGYYWVRYPTKIISNGNLDENNIGSYDISTFNSERQYCKRQQQDQKNDDDKELECRKLRRKVKRVIGPFKYLVDLTETPTDKTPIRERLVQGGIKLYNLQKDAEDLPLWYDLIPKLSIWANVDGKFGYFDIVPPDTIIPPRRGQPYEIQLKEDFILAKGTEKYSLFIGENNDKIGYSIKLESPDLPLQKDLKCKLKMTYAYGDDNPFCLVFIPNDPLQSIHRTIHVKWEKTPVKEAPAPEYPALTTWAELRSIPKSDSNETLDLLEWALTLKDQLKKSDNYQPPKRETGVIADNWRKSIKGDHVTKAYSDSIKAEIRIHESNFIHKDDYSTYQKGDSISFQLFKNNKGKYFGKKIADPKYKDPPRVIQIIHAAFFPIIQIWSNGRSINDVDCPPGFKNEMTNLIEFLIELSQNEGISFRNDIMTLLSFLHKDAPAECIQWIKDKIDSNKIYNYDFRAIGFALGDVSQPWQKDVLQKLKGYLKPIDRIDKKQYWNKKCALRFFAYAIWHDRHFVEQFSPQECRSILDGIVTMLSRIKPCPIDEGKKAVLKWTRETSEPLELLLGMLRTRSSSNKSIKMLLQRNQAITKELITQVNHVKEIVVNDNICLNSRVHLGELSKPKDDNTPDLLYALRLYLTGEDAADAIRITGVSDNEIDD
ncbi:MAG: hypothetical protein IKX40_03335 [Thermoguttaceae bacterium]|nr:hypothetical protein [Thermoguttaceae bacterium]